MSDALFEEFADAMASVRPDSSQASVRFNRVSVLGGGDDARLIAALCLSEGVEVSLFSAYGKELEALQNSGGVTIRGAGPVGTYQVNRVGVPSIKTTAELDSSVQDAEYIFLTGPVHKQRTYAMVLADHLRDGQVLVLTPGRSLGAAETAWLLRVGGCTADYTIIEVQGLPYRISGSGGTLTLADSGSLPAATLPAGRSRVLDKLGAIFPGLVPVANTVHGGFMDGSAIVELPALLLGGPAMPDGMPEVPEGAQPLPQNQTFRALLGERHMRIVEQMAQERREVASRFGVRDLPSTEQWLDMYAGQVRGEGSRMVPDTSQAITIIRCGTIGSLVPLQSAGRLAGVATPATGSMITLASSLLDADIQSAGRSLSSIGINANNIEDARRILDSIAEGRR